MCFQSNTQYFQKLFVTSFLPQQGPDFLSFCSFFSANKQGYTQQQEIKWLNNQIWFQGAGNFSVPGSLATKYHFQSCSPMIITTFEEISQRTLISATHKNKIMDTVLMSNKQWVKLFRVHPYNTAMTISMFKDIKYVIIN